MAKENTIVYKSKILLESGIIDGYLSVLDGVIKYVGRERPDGEIHEICDGIIAPGFVDIHCHGSIKSLAFEDPAEVASFHLSHGTTTMLLSYYRDREVCTRYILLQRWC